MYPSRELKIRLRETAEKQEMLARHMDNIEKNAESIAALLQVIQEEKKNAIEMLRLRQMGDFRR